MSFLTGEVAILLAFFLWSTAGPLVRECGMGWPGFVFFANVAGQAILFVRLGPRRLWGEAREVPRRLLFVLAASVTFNVATLFSAFEYTSITTALLVHYTAPVFVAAWGPFFLGEPRGQRTPLALALALAGLAAVFLGPAAEAFGTGAEAFGTGAEAFVEAGGGRVADLPRRNDLLGIGLALASAFGYAGLLLSMRAAARRGHHADFLALAVSLPVTVVVMPFVDLSAVNVRGVLLAGAGGVLHLPVAGVLYARGMATVAAETAGILGYGEVLFGHFWDVALYGEESTPGMVVGAVLIFLAGTTALGGRHSRLVTAQPPSDGTAA